MIETSARGWWLRTVRTRVSTAPTGWDRANSRGTRRRIDAVVGACVSVIAHPPSFANGNTGPPPDLPPAVPAVGERGQRDEPLGTASIPGCAVLARAARIRRVADRIAGSRDRKST